MSSHGDLVFERMSDEMEICKLREGLGHSCRDCVLVGFQCLKMHEYFNLNVPDRNKGISDAVFMEQKARPYIKRRKPQ